MIGHKRRMFTNAVIAARVKARTVLEKHKLDFATQQQIIQMKMQAMAQTQAPKTEVSNGQQIR